MSEKPRLLWHSNAPQVGTGYGAQTALFLPRLLDHYNLVCSAFYGAEGHVSSWQGVPILPGIQGTYGNECIGEHVRTVFGQDSRSGLVFTLMDVWVLDEAVWSQFNVAAWVPVDHQPAPDPVKRFFAGTGSIPLAMSKFGMEQLEEFDPIYVPHGVDTETLRPMDQGEARKAVGLPEDGFVVGMVAANKGNPSRKCFQESFQAFKAFHDKHPDSVLYLHSEVTGRFQGVDLIRLIEAVGIPRKAVYFADQYRMVHFPFPLEHMRAVYSSIDVLLAPSAGEGFGIPAVEAQACGTPVIVSDFSAQPELVGAGWLVEGTDYYTPIGSWQFRPSVPDIAYALDCAYREHGNPAASKQARAKAEEYAVDKVFADHMLPALQECHERFDARKPTELAVAA